MIFAGCLRKHCLDPASRCSEHALYESTQATVRDRLPFVENEQAISEELGFLEIMRSQEKRDTSMGSETSQGGVDGATRFKVDPYRGLVEEKEQGRCDKAATRPQAILTLLC